MFIAMPKNNHPVEPIVIKNAKIVMKNRNFKGESIPPYNAAGERNFSVLLDPEQVDIQEMIALGWNVKFGKPNLEDPDDVPPAFLRVKVKYNQPGDRNLDRLNPKISMFTSAGETVIDEETVGNLDSVEIVKANLTIRGSWKESPTYTGVVAYLKTMAVRIYEDDEDAISDMREGIMDD